jgi:hypothetical protein
MLSDHVLYLGEVNEVTLCCLILYCVISSHFSVLVLYLDYDLNFAHSPGYTHFSHIIRNAWVHKSSLTPPPFY